LVIAPARQFFRNSLIFIIEHCSIIGHRIKRPEPRTDRLARLLLWVLRSVGNGLVPADLPPFLSCPVEVGPGLDEETEAVLEVETRDFGKRAPG
jgi:hypothetical protein